MGRRRNRSQGHGGMSDDRSCQEPCDYACRRRQDLFESHRRVAAGVSIL